MKVTRVQVFPVALIAIASAVLVAVQSPANAAVTTSTITSPANGSKYMIKDSAPPKTVTVKGTTNGTTGDFVDIRCYQLGSSTYQTATNNVPVQANGSFTTTMDTDDPYGRCRLLAVPTGYSAGATIAGFNGPAVTTEYILSEKLTSGPNAGKTYDHYIEFQGARALNDFGSATGPSLWDSRLSFADGLSSNYLWYGNAGLGDDSSVRNSIKVDGRNAYGPRSAQLKFPNNVGLPSLVFSAVRDSKTGVVTITERNTLVLCPASSTWPATQENCPKFVPSGVRLDRTIVIKDGGLAVHVSDKWVSTDGKSHYISPYYYQSVDGRDGKTNTPTQVGLKLGWSGKYKTYSGAATYSGPTILPDSILVRDSMTANDGNTLFPRGALTFDFPTTVVRTANDVWTLRAKTFKIPGGGSKLTRQSFVMGTTEAGVLAKAAQSEARLR